jgi:DNA-binding cell septation regulator SpoVG
MPSRKNPDDTYRDIVHPINSEFRAILEAAVKEAYDSELKFQMESAQSAELETV